MSSNTLFLLSAAGLLVSLIGVVLCLYASRQANQLDARIKAKRKMVLANSVGKK